MSSWVKKEWVSVWRVCLQQSINIEIADPGQIRLESKVNSRMLDCEGMFVD